MKVVPVLPLAIARAPERSRRHLAALVAAAALVSTAGCDEAGPRVYTAQLYAVESGCLETYAPIGLVEAESVSSLCERVCLLLDEALYVSTVCPPYPAQAGVEPEDSPACAAARAAPACDDLQTSDAAAP